MMLQVHFRVRIDGMRESNTIDYAALDFMLDQISFCLDHLEEKNDHLHAQLQDLLESNREARRDFQQQLNQNGANSAQEAGM
ncbi:UPF0184 C9orf16 homolog [Pelobates cultripes]|uniref:UPF0184 C9orf16 homolog n=1 Tax=Pelobates cultripes TaxID=61616 RepID=A0AAD1WLI8_PELCU|nr:UPF0184 C9orf16 homolog [Pelobates cultripes]